MFTDLTRVKTWRIMSSSSWRRHKFNRKDAAQETAFHIDGDFCMELGLLCTGDDDDQQLREMYGPQC